MDMHTGITLVTSFEFKPINWSLATKIVRHNRSFASNDTLFFVILDHRRNSNRPHRFWTTDVIDVILDHRHIYTTEVNCTRSNVTDVNNIRHKLILESRIT
uniref:Uncharacterized protein n=1 Tax=Cacopsylla melanoneura TaxID=428564 RepID=A0A8D9BLW7_9HEMI